jgi:hypothetical protein
VSRVQNNGRTGGITGKGSVPGQFDFEDVEAAAEEFRRRVLHLAKREPDST